MDKSAPTGAALLLDFIYRTDAEKAPPHFYQVIFGNRQKHLPKPNTQMTLGNLIDVQKNWLSKAGSKRAGAIPPHRRRQAQHSSCAQHCKICRVNLAFATLNCLIKIYKIDSTFTY